MKMALAIVMALLVSALPMLGYADVDPETVTAINDGVTDGKTLFNLGISGVIGIALLGMGVGLFIGLIRGKS